MQLFAGDVARFEKLAINNELSPELVRNFQRHFGHRPSDSEVRSWVVSLKDLAVSTRSVYLGDAHVVVEYRMPNTSRRLDAMFVGKSAEGRDRATIVELKQWDRAYKADVDECVVFRPGARSYRLHPSLQASGYAEYLSEAHTAFYDDDGLDDFVEIDACCFLHNGHSEDCGDLLDSSFRHLVERAPVFFGNDRERLEQHLISAVGCGGGADVMARVESGRAAPSKKLLEHAASVIAGNPVFTLIDNQRVAFNVVHSLVEKAIETGKKSAVIVQGGPGTGKSVVAVQLVAALAREQRSVVHCTGSTAFTTNLRAQVGGRAAQLFKYFLSFMRTPDDTFDVLVADEAHRIRHWTSGRMGRGTKEEIYELMDSSRVSVYLMDPKQVVRPDEVGSPELVRNAAQARRVEVYELDLDDQFRCSGSDGYLRWLDHTFGLSADDDLGWRGQYEFQVFDSPRAMERALKAKCGEGYTARMVAGFCWPWSDPNSDGTLVNDVVVGDWQRPWNRKRTGSTTPKNDPYTLWATRDESFAEVGCIYSAQGFEFDYCGVIVGKDLVWSPELCAWVAQRGESQDRAVVRGTRSDADLAQLLRQTYRVLMSRGMKGTYVTFLDAKTEAHFRERLNVARGTEAEN